MYVCMYVYIYIYIYIKENMYIYVYIIYSSQTFIVRNIFLQISDKNVNFLIFLAYKLSKPFLNLI